MRRLLLDSETSLQFADDPVWTFSCCETTSASRKNSLRFTRSRQSLVLYEDARRRRLGALPSYLDIVIPRVLVFLKERDLKITFFIVGMDADQPAHQKCLRPPLSMPGTRFGDRFLPS